MSTSIHFCADCGGTPCRCSGDVHQQLEAAQERIAKLEETLEKARKALQQTRDDNLDYRIQREALAAIAALGKKEGAA